MDQSWRPGPTNVEDYGKILPQFLGDYTLNVGHKPQNSGS